MNKYFLLLAACLLALAALIISPTDLWVNCGAASNCPYGAMEFDKTFFTEFKAKLGWSLSFVMVMSAFILLSAYSIFKLYTGKESE